MSQRALAIGGSTGSIPVIEQLLGGLSVDLDIPVFVVVHVGAEGRDLLAEIFSKSTSLPVTTAEDGEPVLPGRVYVAPADKHLLVIDGYVRLGRGPRENLSRPALDPLFRSVALMYGSGAICLVVSGHLNDGAAGLAAVKDRGGLAIVQNPMEATARDMPMGALAACDVDYRTCASDLAGLVVTILATPAGQSKPIAPDLELEVDIALGRPCLTATIAEIAVPVPLSCPSCGGVLSELKRGPLRFRCQVGHAFSAQSLAAQQEGSLDEAVRVALRIVEERATLLERMDADALKAGRSHLSGSFSKKVAELRQYAEVLRSAALNLPSGHMPER
ncbi:chemotaxis protein CheB (plasmid) [Paracoccus marcusii]|uniref:chemotaxis protein CheB n=1 Tax=Paracoccus TaxID=265 RepID=UPI001891968F|nr:chemotaxis protein CheB [Paracoccus sp. NBH48]MBF5080055.1 chemotaxis protein CheB [Paracoccus sp. NBH48]